MKLRAQRPGQLNNFGVESFGETLEGKLPGGYLSLDDVQSSFREDEWEAGFLAMREEKGVFRGGVSLSFSRGTMFFELFKGPMKGFGFEEGHVAGEEEDGAGA